MSHNQKKKTSKATAVFETVIGKGNSGVVFKGYYQDQPCALKYAENGLEENQMIQSLKHKNIISSHGVTEYGEKEYMILEYMNQGDLKAFLSKHTCNYHQIYHWALQLAKAISYLHSKDIIHTDIAARNCLLSHENCAEIPPSSPPTSKSLLSDSLSTPVLMRSISNTELLTLKLSDFGECVHNMKEGSKPRYALKWASPEVLLSGVLSKSSDVWAFGITLYEMITNGGDPFPNQDRAEIEKNIKNGNLPKLPEECPQDLKDIISQCLEMKYQRRPSMQQIVKKLKKLFKTHEHNNCHLSISQNTDELSTPRASPETGLRQDYYDDNNNEDLYLDKVPKVLYRGFFEGKEQQSQNVGYVGWP